MEVKNLHKNKPKTEDKNVNPFCPVHPARILIVGDSGSGKTNMAGSLIMHNMPFDRLYVISKHLDDPNDIYDKLENFCNKIESKIRKKLKDDTYTMHWFSDKLEDLPLVEELDYDYRNLVLIDDMINEPHQEMINEYFTSGRHKNCTTIYLSQRYHNVPKIVRSNSNYFCFFRMPTKDDVRLIANSHATDFPFKDFQKIYNEAVKDKYSFLVIDKQTDKKPLKYRKKWDELLKISDSTNI